MARRDARSLDHKTLEEIRILAVERVQAGESPEDIIRTLGFTRSCIYTWLALYRAGGWGALRARALKQLGLSCQRPLFRAVEQDPERVRQWLDEEYPRIRRQTQRQRAEIYFGDEAGVRSDYHSGTRWGAKGRTPVVLSTGQRNSVNMISAVSARGHLRFMLTKGRVNGTVFVEFLKRLMHNAQRPIFLILDGGSFHHSRPVRDYVDSLEGKLHLFFLPSYSPELNPDEQVWNYVKHHG